MTKIEWADESLNLWAGCTKISEGCENCWAESMSNRLAGQEAGIIRRGKSLETRYLPVIRPGLGKWNGTINSHFNYPLLMRPLDWKTPRMIFVNSMSDTFHEQVPDDDLDKLWTMMALCSHIQWKDDSGDPVGKPYHHTFQILTKRPGRMLEYLTRRTLEQIVLNGSELLWGDKPGFGEWQDWAFWNTQGNLLLRNVWLGVTTENQEYFNERVLHLIQCPARVRFISAEPLLGPINNFGPALSFNESYRTKKLINWVICGGESGPGSRPMHPNWVRTIRDKCRQFDVPFFFKQWGAWCPGSLVLQDEPYINGWKMQNGKWASSRQYSRKKCFRWDINEYAGYPEGNLVSFKLDKKRSGDLLDGETYHETPEDYIDED